MRPPRSRTWGRRGITPVIRVRCGGTGRVSVAGLACYRPGHRCRLIYRLHRYRGRKGETKAFTWVEYRDLLIAAHRQLPGGNIVLAYSAWLEPFERTEFARTLHDHGTEPLIQIEPGDASLTAITGGRYDPYLRSYATEVREFGQPVILSFAPEANGSWYPWGWTRSSPAAWVAAWRHVVTVFRQQEARNVTWLWTVNIGYQGSAPLRDYWPGAKLALGAQAAAAPPAPPAGGAQPCRASEGRLRAVAYPRRACGGPAARSLMEHSRAIAAADRTLVRAAGGWVILGVLAAVQLVVPGAAIVHVALPSSGAPRAFAGAAPCSRPGPKIPAPRGDCRDETRRNGEPGRPCRRGAANRLADIRGQRGKPCPRISVAEAERPGPGAGPGCREAGQVTLAVAPCSQSPQVMPWLGGRSLLGNREENGISYPPSRLGRAAARSGGGGAG